MQAFREVKYKIAEKLIKKYIPDVFLTLSKYSKFLFWVLEYFFTYT